MPRNDLAYQPAMQQWIDTLTDQEFALALCAFIDDYAVVGPGVAGAHVVDALEGVAQVLRQLGWSEEK
jgi:hypothetical protein